MKKSIAYITIDGILEPLGQSQILSYLLLMSREYDFTIYSLEKFDDLKNLIEVDLLNMKLKEKNINWKYSIYKKNRLLSKFNFFKLLILILRNKPYRFSLIHSRSFLPALIAYIVHQFYKIPYIYDMRGYWLEEKYELGVFNGKKTLYQILSKIDKNLISNASHIFTLSTVSTNYLSGLYNLKNRISTIYTATDLNKFYEKPIIHKQYITIGYVGTTLGWYNFNETLNFINIAFKKSDLFRFKLITKDKDVLKKIIDANIDLNKVEIINSSFSDIEYKLDDLDYAVFFINRSFSKSASMPTKFGEFLSKGIPCITNDGVGDVSSIIYQNPKIGYVVNSYTSFNYDIILNELLDNYLNKESFVNYCRTVAKEYFSIELCINNYLKTYKLIIN